MVFVFVCFVFKCEFCWIIHDFYLFFSQAPRPQLPIEGPWRQASLKSFIKNVDAGKPETGTVSYVAEKNEDR